MRAREGLRYGLKTRHGATIPRHPREAVSSHVEQASSIRRDGSRARCGGGFGAKRRD